MNRLVKITLIGGLALAAAGCVTAPHEPVRERVIVHEVHHAAPRHVHVRGGNGRYDETDVRQHEQRQAIEKAYRSGALTQTEARKLQEEQRDIAREERRYEADGRLTRRERAELDRELDQAARHIRSEARDDDRRSRR